MKLTKQQIQYIDSYLSSSGISYLDLRMELLDHFVLATEDEMINANVDFEEALKMVALSFGNKISSKYVLDKKEWKWKIEENKQTNEGFQKLIKEKRKQIHWSQQRELFKIALSFLIKTPKNIIAFGIIFCLYFATTTLDFATIKLLLLFSVAIPQIAQFFFHFKKYKKMISGENVLSVMALPSLFLYMFSVVDEILFENQWLLLTYWLFALVLNISGLITISNIRKRLVSQYKLLTT